MKSAVKRSIALLLSLLITLSMMPATVFAVESQDEEATQTTETAVEAEEPEEPEHAPAFDATAAVDGVKVTVKAGEGILPEGSVLEVSNVSKTEEKKVLDAVEKERDENTNVASYYTFDIKVLDKEGNEVQPADGEKVEVLFEADEVANKNLDTSVYHLKDEGELVAETLDAEEKGNTVSAETNGFSYYTVEFTYGELQYSMNGDTEVALSTILENIGLYGTVTEAVSSNPELFSIEKKAGEFVVVAKKAFKSNETLSLTIDGIDYVVKVTDAQTYYWNVENPNPVTLNTGDTLIISGNVTSPKNGIKVAGDNVTITLAKNAVFMPHSFTVNNKNFTLNIEEGAQFSNTSSSTRPITFNGKGGVINYNGANKAMTSLSAINLAFKGSSETTLNVNAEGAILENLRPDDESVVNVNLYKDCTLKYFNSATTGSVTIDCNEHTLTSQSEWKISGTTSVIDIKKIVIGYGGQRSIECLPGGTYVFEGHDAVIVRNDPRGGTYSLFSNKGNLTISGFSYEMITSRAFITNWYTATATLNNINIAAGDTVVNSSYMLFNGDTAKMTLNNVNLDARDKPLLGGIRFQGGTAIYNSGTISGVKINSHESAAISINAGMGESYFIMNGGRVTGNARAMFVGGAAHLVVAGSAEISGNETNAYLKEGAVFKVVDTTEVPFTGSVGVSSEVTPTEDNPVQITESGTSRLVDVFSDNPAYSVGLKDDFHVLMIHQHGWAFDEGKTHQQGDTLIASCDVESNPQCLYYKEATDHQDVRLSIATVDGQTEYMYDEANPVARPAALKNRQMLEATTGATVGEIEYYKGSTKLDSAPTEKGSYTAKAKITDADGQEYTVAFSYKIKGDSAAPVAKNLTYNGMEQELVELTDALEDGQVMLYKTAEGDEWTTSIPKATNAGTYKVWYMIQGEPDSEGTVDDAAIKQAPVIVKGITASDKVYDGSTNATVNTKDATIEGTFGEDTLTVSTTGTFGTKDVETGKTVTLGALTLEGSSSANYKPAQDSQKETKASITPLAVKVSGITAEDKKFDGNTDATLNYDNVEFEGIIDGDTLTVTATGKFSDANVGKNKTVNLTDITLGGDAAGNYELTSEGQQTTATASIKGEEMTVSASGYEGEYDENAHSITVTVTVPASGYTVTYKGPDDTEYSSTNPAFQDPGEYEVSYKVTADNYETFTGTATVKIKGASFDGITSSGYSDEYDGNAHGITVKVPETYTGYTISYSTTETGTYSTDPITYTDFTDGDKTVYFKVSKKGYNDFKSSNKVNITKKSTEDIDPTKEEDEDLAYDGNPQKPTIEVKDGDKTLEEDTDYTVKYVGVEPTEYGPNDTPPTNPGNYEAIIEFKGNYEGDPKTVPFEVDKGKQDPPTDITSSPTSSDTATDGKISGVDDTMQYSTDGGETWNDVKEGETEIKDLGKGEVLVRYKETDLRKASEPVSIKINRKSDDTLLAQMTAKGKKSMVIRWTKVDGADGYDIFFSKCNAKGKKYTPKLIKTVRGNGTFKFTKKKLKKKVAYKAYVRAFKMEGGRKQYISTSMMYHGFTSGYKGKYTDAKRVTVNRSSVSLNRGGTFRVTAKIKKVKPKKLLIKTSHAPHLRYVSSNNYIATVDGNGVITAKSGGTCYVYAVATNGVRSAVQVTVK